MEIERLIASLYARRRRLILGLKDFERRAEVYRSAINELEAKLQSLRPFVPPFKPRSCGQYLTSREFARGYHDAVREAEGKALTVDDVVTFLMQRKELDIADAVLHKAMRRRVVEMRRRMRQRGTIA